MPPADQASHPEPPGGPSHLLKVLEVLQFALCGVPQAATPPPAPCWMPPFSRAAWRDHRQLHEREFFPGRDGVESCLPPPLLCQAKLLSSWCSKGTCDTQEGLGGQSPHSIWLLFLLLGAMVDSPPHHPQLQKLPLPQSQTLTHLRPGPNKLASDAQWRTCAATFRLPWPRP